MPKTVVAPATNGMPAKVVNMNLTDQVAVLAWLHAEQAEAVRHLSTFRHPDQEK